MLAPFRLGSDSLLRAKVDVTYRMQEDYPYILKAWCLTCKGPCHRAFSRTCVCVFYFLKNGAEEQGEDAASLLRNVWVESTFRTNYLMCLGVGAGAGWKLAWITHIFMYVCAIVHRIQFKVKHRIKTKVVALQMIIAPSTVHDNNKRYTGRHSTMHVQCIFSLDVCMNALLNQKPRYIP